MYANDVRNRLPANTDRPVELDELEMVSKWEPDGHDALASAHDDTQYGDTYKHESEPSVPLSLYSVQPSAHLEDTSISQMPPIDGVGVATPSFIRRLPSTARKQ
jgi:hypothetical protein